MKNNTPQQATAEQTVIDMDASIKAFIIDEANMINRSVVIDERIITIKRMHLQKLGEFLESTIGRYDNYSGKSLESYVTLVDFNNAFFSETGYEVYPFVNQPYCEFEESLGNSVELNIAANRKIETYRDIILQTPLPTPALNILIDHYKNVLINNGPMCWEADDSESGLYNVVDIFPIADVDGKDVAWVDIENVETDETISMPLSDLFEDFEFDSDSDLFNMDDNNILHLVCLNEAYDYNQANTSAENEVMPIRFNNYGVNTEVKELLAEIDNEYKINITEIAKNMYNQNDPAQANNEQFPTFTLAQATAVCEVYPQLENVAISDGFSTTTYQKLCFVSVKGHISACPDLAAAFKPEQLDEYLLILTSTEFKGDIKKGIVTEASNREFIIGPVVNDKVDSLEHLLLEFEERKEAYPALYTNMPSKNELLKMFYETKMENGTILQA